MTVDQLISALSRLTPEQRTRRVMISHPENADDIDLGEIDVDATRRFGGTSSWPDEPAIVLLHGKDV